MAKAKSREDAGIQAPLMAYSIPQFCRVHGISESFFHKLRADGHGPQELRLGTRVLISCEAAAAWRAQHTAASATSTDAA